VSAKHTPRPWKIGDGQIHSDFIYGNSALSICEVFRNGNDDNRNKYLISAAPELLEALEEMLSASDLVMNHELDGPSIKARAAIAKAKGDVI
jgi:hypothetical protein